MRILYLDISIVHAVVRLNAVMFLRYKTDINSYKQKVKESIEACQQATMNPDPSDPHSVKYEANNIVKE